MGREEQIIAERLRKVKELREHNINPYVSKANKEKTIEACLKLGLGKNARNAGRLMSVRNLGKIAFGVLRDSTGDMQIVLQEGKTPENVRAFFKKYCDSGDFVEVSGKIIKTKTGEKSILVDALVLLTKSILPLPEKFHGLKDDEERLRKRYLDILMNDSVAELFRKKALFWQTMREFLLKRGFLEVETPVLETAAGGAAATPFATHHNALDMEVFLRISMGELWQKKLMVAGFEKTFEIGRQFRNEGMDAEHLQDYTQMEFYWAYANYHDGMKLVEAMYKEVVKAVLGKYMFETNGHKVDLAKKWVIYDYETVIKKYTGIAIYEASALEIKKKLDSLNVSYDKSQGKWRLIDTLWKVARKKLGGPGFLTGQPVEVSPLAKRSAKDSRKVEQFQVIIAGTEMGNGYSELNDPLDQEERFKEQRALKESGDAEAHEHDESFVEALKYGMPPTCGFGVSERLFSTIMNKPIRECVLFPLMKPLDKTKGKKT